MSMRVLRGVEAARADIFRAPVAATIGVFDGVHRGHRRILDALVAWAHEDGGEAVVVTFDRHPREVLVGEKPAALASLEHRLVLLARAGVDAVLVLPFDERTAATSAEDFVRDVLTGTLGAKKVLLGANHRFGHGRRGDLALLERLGPEHGFVARSVELEPADDAGHVVSSTAIREAIREGRLSDAERMLGRPVTVLGKVARGEARGRTLGFPTANLDLQHEARPPRGVYAALASIGEGEDPPTAGARRGLAVVTDGRRPTFHPEAGEDLLEVHLLDFHGGDLYGRLVEVSFLAKLRDEVRFSGAEALVAQIRSDVASARLRFGGLVAPAHRPNG
ncbi:bifunctional riboflavin kinase/FAD synthetase [bacterium]|nr:bifunctional riboflavin kinase/FAD synthetase [bacterium]